MCKMETTMAYVNGVGLECSSHRLYNPGVCITNNLMKKEKKKSYY